MTRTVDTTQSRNGFTTTAKEADMQDETIVHAINHAFAAIGALTYEHQPTALATPDAIITLVQLLTRQPGNDDDLTTAAGFARKQTDDCLAHAKWLEGQAAAYTNIAAAVDDLLLALRPQEPPKEARQPAASRPRRPKASKA